MKLKRKPTEKILEFDMTPMIDMTFQLIAFFMMLINFAQTESHQRVTLPDSELAKPPQAPFDFPITVHFASDGAVILGGEETEVEGMGVLLSRYANILKGRRMTPEDATIIIRADKDARTGRVQEVIEACQKANFVNFMLRAKEDITVRR